MPRDIISEIENEKNLIDKSVPGNEELVNRLDSMILSIKENVQSFNIFLTLFKKFTFNGMPLRRALPSILNKFDSYNSVVTGGGFDRRSDIVSRQRSSSGQTINEKASLSIDIDFKSLEKRLNSFFKDIGSYNIDLGFSGSDMAVSGIKSRINELNKMSDIPRFASGGEVTGGPRHGDQILARVNAGEKILNEEQWNNIRKLIQQKTGERFSDQDLKSYVFGGKAKPKMIDGLPAFARGTHRVDEGDIRPTPAAGATQSQEYLSKQAINSIISVLNEGFNKLTKEGQKNVLLFNKVFSEKIEGLAVNGELNIENLKAVVTAASGIKNVITKSKKDKAGEVVADRLSDIVSDSANIGRITQQSMKSFLSGERLASTGRAEDAFISFKSQISSIKDLFNAAKDYTEPGTKGRVNYEKHLNMLGEIESSASFDEYAASSGFTPKKIENLLRSLTLMADSIGDIEYAFKKEADFANTLEDSRIIGSDPSLTGKMGAVFSQGDITQKSSVTALAGNFAALRSGIEDKVQDKEALFASAKHLAGQKDQEKALTKAKHSSGYDFMQSLADELLTKRQKLTEGPVGGDFLTEKGVYDKWYQSFSDLGKLINDLESVGRKFSKQQRDAINIALNDVDDKSLLPTVVEGIKRNIQVNIPAADRESIRASERFDLESSGREAFFETFGVKRDERQTITHDPADSKMKFGGKQALALAKESEKISDMPTTKEKARGIEVFEKKQSALKTQTRSLERFKGYLGDEEKTNIDALLTKITESTSKEEIENTSTLLEDYLKVIEETQDEVKNLDDLMRNWGTTLEKNAKSIAQSSKIFGKSPKGMMAYGAAIEIVTTRLLKFSQTHMKAAVDISVMKKELLGVKSVAKDVFNEREFENTRKSLNLTRAEMLAFGDSWKGLASVSRATGVEMSNIVHIIDNVRANMGKIDAGDIKNIEAILTGLSDTQVDVLITGTGSFDDKANTLLNLMDAGKLDVAIEMMQKGAFGEMDEDDMIKLPEGDRKLIEGQQTANAILEEIKFGIQELAVSLPFFEHLPVLNELASFASSSLAKTIAGVTTLTGVLLNFQVQKSAILANVSAIATKSGVGGAGGTAKTVVELLKKKFPAIGKGLEKVSSSLSLTAAAWTVGAAAVLYGLSKIASSLDKQRRGKRKREELGSRHDIGADSVAGGKTMTGSDSERTVYGGLSSELSAAAVGALVGGAIGTIFPAIGTAIGATIGGVAGYIYGAVKYWHSTIGYSVENIKYFKDVAERYKKIYDHYGKQIAEQRAEMYNSAIALRQFDSTLKLVSSGALVSFQKLSKEAAEFSLKGIAVGGGTTDSFALNAGRQIEASASMFFTNTKAINASRLDAVKNEKISAEARSVILQKSTKAQVEELDRFVQGVMAALGRFSDLPSISKAFTQLGTQEARLKHGQEAGFGTAGSEGDWKSGINEMIKSQKDAFELAEKNFQVTLKNLEKLEIENKERAKEIKEASQGKKGTIEAIAKSLNVKGEYTEDIVDSEGNISMKSVDANKAFLDKLESEIESKLSKNTSVEFKVAYENIKKDGDDIGKAIEQYTDKAVYSKKTKGERATDRESLLQSMHSIAASADKGNKNNYQSQQLEERLKEKDIAAILNKDRDKLTSKDIQYLAKFAENFNKDAFADFTTSKLSQEAGASELLQQRKEVKGQQVGMSIADSTVDTEKIRREAEKKEYEGLSETFQKMIKEFDASLKRHVATPFIQWIGSQKGILDSIEGYYGVFEGTDVFLEKQSALSKTDLEEKRIGYSKAEDDYKEYRQLMIDQVNGMEGVSDEFKASALNLVTAQESGDPVSVKEAQREYEKMSQKEKESGKGGQLNVDKVNLAFGNITQASITMQQASASMKNAVAAAYKNEVAKVEFSKKMLGYREQENELQRSLIAEIGGSPEYVLSIERKSVALAQEKLEKEREALKLAEDANVSEEEMQIKRLAVISAENELTKKKLGMQRSMIEQMMGSMIGGFTSIGAMKGAGNLANILGQGYMDVGGGMYRATDAGTVGYSERMFNARSGVGGEDPSRNIAPAQRVRSGDIQGKGYASGGIVGGEVIGGIAGKDSVPFKTPGHGISVLMPGEMVLNKKQQGRLSEIFGFDGKEMFDLSNTSGSINKHADGKPPVGKSSPVNAMVKKSNQGTMEELLVDILNEIKEITGTVKKSKEEIDGQQSELEKAIQGADTVDGAADELYKVLKKDDVKDESTVATLDKLDLIRSSIEAGATNVVNALRGSGGAGIAGRLFGGVMPGARLASSAAGMVKDKLPDILSVGKAAGKMMMSASPAISLAGKVKDKASSTFGKATKWVSGFFTKKHKSGVDGIDSPYIKGEDGKMIKRQLASETAPAVAGGTMAPAIVASPDIIASNNMTSKAEVRSSIATNIQKAGADNLKSKDGKSGKIQIEISLNNNILEAKIKENATRDDVAVAIVKKGASTLKV